MANQMDGGSRASQLNGAKYSLTFLANFNNTPKKFSLRKS